MLPKWCRAIHFSLSNWIPCRNKGISISKKPTTLGQFLRRRRAELGLKQYQVAKQFGVSLVSVNKWERDLFIPKRQYFERLSKFLGFNVVEYFALPFETTRK